MKIKSLSVAVLVSLFLSIAARYSQISWNERVQDNLTTELCQLMGLPLNTGSLREAFEGFESALRRSGQSNFCVGITDNGRSYSPDCFVAGNKYRATICKAEANTGVRAFINYEQQSIFSMPLLYIWLALFFGGIALVLIFRGAAKVLVKAFSTHVTVLLSNKSNRTEGFLPRASAWILEKLGISKILEAQGEQVRKLIQANELNLLAKTRVNIRLEEEAKHSKAYVEKVRQIRHDIRSPLTSLQTMFDKASPESESTKSLAWAIRRIQLLIDDLSDVDRVKEERSLLIAEVVVDEIVLFIRDKFEGTKSASLSFKYSDKELCPISVGRKDFHSLIENLLENALDAITMNGTVTVTVQNSGGFCEITVDDNGCGVSQEAAVKLFSRGGTFGKLSGVGLGLYHCKKIVESWGGTIEHQPLQVGARFRARIPLMQTGVMFVGLDEGARLKIIDDENSIPNVLAQAGFEILETVTSFEAGRALLAKGRAEGVTILVDNRLGDEKFGTDLIAEQPLRTGVLLCTNDFDNLDVIARVRKIGVKILPKPICFSKVYSVGSRAPKQFQAAPSQLNAPL